MTTKRAVVLVTSILLMFAMFIFGAWYAIRYADVRYDADRGLHVLAVFGRSEYWYFEPNEDKANISSKGNNP